MLYLKPLHAVTPNELQAVGQRASDLAQLGSNRMPVPHTFVVLSTAMDELVRTNGLKYKIDYILSHVQEHIPSSLVNAYNGARKAILEATLPNGLETELRELYDGVTSPAAVGDLVATNDRVPVRIIMSVNRSGDSENNDTIIQNIGSFEELLVGLREAWALSYHPSQFAERLKEKFPESRHKVALIVQVMDKPRASAHTYSCLPQDHHKIYLQVYPGYPDLREKIAKDYYAVAKDGLQIVASQLQQVQSRLDINEAKELAVTPQPDRFELIDRDLQEIARLTKKAEIQLQTPVKCFFTIVEDGVELLWANRLGFEILIKNDVQESAAPVMHAPHIEPIVHVPKPEPAPSAEDFLTMADEPVQEAAVEQQEMIAPAVESAQELIDEAPVAQQDEESELAQEVALAQEQEELAVVESEEEVVVEEAMPVAAPVEPVRSMEMNSGVAAKLLKASLRIVRQVAERKYRSTFGETAVVDNLAEMINRLNEANVFSRAVDGPLLLQAEQAAHNDGKVSEAEYAKIIEEVAFLMNYA